MLCHTLELERKGIIYKYCPFSCDVIIFQNKFFFFFHLNIFVIVVLVQISEALESFKEVRSIFLDISKAFDKVWHACLLCKLEALGIRHKGSYLNCLRLAYLRNRKLKITYLSEV